MNETKPYAKDPLSYTKHGIKTLKRAVRVLGDKAIDRRTRMGKALALWRTDLIRDLGGTVSTQQSSLIDLAVKTKLMLDSVDAWILQQPSLINKRKRSILPVVMQRTTLADSLARYLMTLGLERRSRDLDLTDALTRINAEDDNNGT